jgi:hypothetical protein
MAGKERPEVMLPDGKVLLFHYMQKGTSLINIP